jgi:ADP-heptose:LPS heptosyltransferase
LDPLEDLLGVEAVTKARACWTRPVDRDELLAPRQEEQTAALRRLGLTAAPPQGFLALHPGSGGRSKCWPVERFLQLARQAQREDYTPVVFLGPADDECRRAIQAASRVPAPPGFLLADSLPLREVLALLALARAYVGNDSGVTHLAARAGPTLALFGPTDPRVWRPLGPAVRVLRAPKGELARLSCETVWQALCADFRF